MELASFGRINLVSGPNDVGKTALLEALFLHASGPLAGQLAIQVVRPSRSQSGIDINSSADSPWNAFFHGFDQTAAIRLSGSYDGTHYDLSLSQPSTEQSLDFSKGGDSAQQVWSSVLELSEHRESRSPQSYSTTITVQTGSIPGLGGQQAIVQTRIDPHASRPFQPAGFLPSNRAAATDLGAGYSSLRQQRRDGDLIEALRVVDDRIASLELLLSDGRPTLHAVLEDGSLIPFPLMGDGISSVAAMIVNMTGLRGGVLLIDEIENGLHYSVLKQLWHHLFSVARRLNVQIFAATHSHECVVAAYDALSGQPNALTLVQLARNTEDAGVPVVAVYDGQTLGAGIELGASLR